MGLIMGEKLRHAVLSVEKGSGLKELLHVYQDLEKTLAALKEVAASQTSLKCINVSHAVNILVKRKKILERKIANTLLLEKSQLKLKISQILVDPPPTTPSS